MDWESCHYRHDRCCSKTSLEVGTYPQTSSPTGGFLCSFCLTFIHLLLPPFVVKIVRHLPPGTIGREALGGPVLLPSQVFRGELAGSSVEAADRHVLLVLWPVQRLCRQHAARPHCGTIMARPRIQMCCRGSPRARGVGGIDLITTKRCGTQTGSMNVGCGTQRVPREQGNASQWPTRATCLRQVPHKSGRWDHTGGEPLLNECRCERTLLRAGGVNVVPGRGLAATRIDRW
mmetsp:Transcript_6861/g.20878  ORF Transcript_6861/g.20878 Transcript_6861/m.20878 type:complete len:232 (+) Transcript_6861:71-766(+)